MRTIAGGPGRYTKKQQKNEGKRGVNCLKLSHTKAAARKQRWTPDRRQQTGDRSGCSCLLLRSADETNHIISRRRCCTLFLKNFVRFVSFGPRLILGAKPMSPAFGCKLWRHVWSVAAAFSRTLQEIKCYLIIFSIYLTTFDIKFSMRFYIQNFKAWDNRLAQS